MQDLMRFLPALVDQLEDNQTAREAFAFAAWRKSAGSGLRQRTAPLELLGDRLVVAVTDESWKKNLEELAGQMIFKINSSVRMELVRFIEFRIDADAVDGENSDSAVEHASDRFDASAEITDELRLSAEAIGDEGLREQFLLAAAGCLARKKRMGI